MPKKEVLEMCEKAIRDELGTLEDLPYELANTVANVYYRFFTLGLDAIKRRPHSLPASVKRKNSLAKGMATFMQDSTRSITDVESVADFIKGLREIDKRQQPNLYQYSVDFILDFLKYDIKNVHEKTGLRRMVERKIKKNKVNEIPNLVDLMDI